jgi:transcriptional regulator of acetoin/glycerol metabolism
LETKLLARARDTFLETRRWAEGVALRPEIAASWSRCALIGIDPDRAGCQRRGRGEVHAEGRLWTAAEPVLKDLRERLAETETGTLLCDRECRVIYRHAADPLTARAWEASNIDLGSSLSEAAAGTNAIGSVLEVEVDGPLVVSGGEHFLTTLHRFACVGAQIRHPVTRQLLGVVGVVCRIERANPFLRPFALEAAREVERRLYLESSRHERLLLEHFLVADKRRGRAIIVLNDGIVITNPPAARILGDVEQGLLWEHAAAAIHGRSNRASDLALPSGRVLRTACSPIADGRDVIGALLEIEVPREPASSRRRQARRRRAPQPPLEGLVGTSGAWRALLREAAAYRDGDLPLLLRGEPGVGKQALVRALFAEQQRAGRLRIFDGALQPIEGTAWLRAVREGIAERDGVVVIRHVDALRDDAVPALCSLIDAIGDGGPRVVGTLTEGGSGRRALPELVDRLAVGTLVVPPLRDRLEDLPELVDALMRRHAPARSLPRWRPDALQTLSRLDWPANVRQLENLVRRVLATRRSADVRAQDLPDDIRGQAPRRELAYLERVELEAIMVALQRTSGNKMRAAELLGISRATLYRKLRSFGADLDKTVF